MKEKLYGSVFNKEITDEVSEFISSIDIDKRLLKYDINGSIAHAKMLGKTKIITKKEKDALVKGLKKLLDKLKKDQVHYPKKKDIEDVHTFVNYLLKKSAGVPKKIVDKLHTARSRNEQIAMDERLYCLDAVDNIIGAIVNLQKSIYSKAKQNKKTIMPSYTHLQPAQAITVSQLLCAYLKTLEKDKTRLKDAKENIDIMPSGSGAVRGTTLKIDRDYLKKALGFSKISENSIEAVSTRDFISQLLSAVTILSTNLSRMAEDLIIYSTYEFSFINLDDRYLSGSSMMPNKKNPDTLELIRGFSAKALGALVENMTLMMKLPHTYNRDMQYDKGGLFQISEGIIKCLDILSGIFKTLSFNKKRLKQYIEENDFIFATDISEFLIKQGLNHKKAHDATGKIIKLCLKNKRRIKDLTDKELKIFSKHLDEGKIKELTDAVLSIKRVSSEGSTSFKSVNKQLNKWKRMLKVNA